MSAESNTVQANESNDSEGSNCLSKGSKSEDKLSVCCTDEVLECECEDEGKTAQDVCSLKTPSTLCSLSTFSISEGPVKCSQASREYHEAEYEAVKEEECQLKDYFCKLEKQISEANQLKKEYLQREKDLQCQIEQNQLKIERYIMRKKEIGQQQAITSSNVDKYKQMSDNINGMMEHEEGLIQKYCCLIENESQEAQHDDCHAQYQTEELKKCICQVKFENDEIVCQIQEQQDKIRLEEERVADITRELYQVDVEIQKETETIAQLSTVWECKCRKIEHMQRELNKESEKQEKLQWDCKQLEAEGVKIMDMLRCQEERCKNIDQSIKDLQQQAKYLEIDVKQLRECIKRAKEERKSVRSRKECLHSEKGRLNKQITCTSLKKLEVKQRIYDREFDNDENSYIAYM